MLHRIGQSGLDLFDARRAGRHRRGLRDHRGRVCLRGQLHLRWWWRWAHSAHRSDGHVHLAASCGAHSGRHLHDQRHCTGRAGELQSRRLLLGLFARWGGRDVHRFRYLHNRRQHPGQHRLPRRHGQSEHRHQPALGRSGTRFDSKCDGHSRRRPGSRVVVRTVECLQVQERLLRGDGITGRGEL